MRYDTLAVAIGIALIDMRAAAASAGAAEGQSEPQVPCSDSAGAPEPSAADRG